MNSRDSFPRRKFNNRAPISCSPGPMLWTSAISFELHDKMAEEIDLEKCTFRNYGSSVTLTLDRVEVILVRIGGGGLPTHTKLDGNRKKTLWTYGRTHLSSDLLGQR